MPSRRASDHTWGSPYGSAFAGLAMATVLFGACSRPSSDAATRSAMLEASAEESVTQIELQITRDTWVSSVPGERRGNNGASHRLKLKSFQEMSLLDFDPEDMPPSPRVIESAELVLEASGTDAFPRLSVSTVASPWQEGFGRFYLRGTNGASFAQPARRAHWKEPGSDLATVVLGSGETLWSVSDPRPSGPSGEVAFAIDPRLVAARRAGLSAGLLLFDDVGSEYQRQGDRLTAQPFPNRFLFSREAWFRHPPVLRLELGKYDDQPPNAIATIDQLDGPVDGPGEARITWLTPTDRGPAGVLGFDVAVQDEPKPPNGDAFDWSSARLVDRHQIPFAKAAGEPVAMHLRDLGTSGSRVTVALRAVDAVGHRGATTTHSVALSKARTPAPWPSPRRHGAAKQGSDAFLPGPGGGRMWIVDPALQVDPRSGDSTPLLPGERRHTRELFDPVTAQVTLAAARNEFVAFILVLEEVPGAQLAELHVANPQSANPRRASPLTARLYYAPPVEGRGSASRRLLIDPLERLSTGEASGLAVLPVSSPPLGATETLRFRTLYVEFYVPHGAPAGRHKAELILKGSAGERRLQIEIEVLGFSLPDHLSFRPQLNAYRLPAEAGGPKQLAYYRLAHEHRTVLNRLAYNWQGEVRDGHAPALRAGSFDFSAWDRAFGPLFDGTAFAGLPRSGVPIEAFYLPVHENWPVPIEPAFLGGYWIESAVEPSYFEALERRLRELARHLAQRGWLDTSFEVYLNNRVKFKTEAGRWNASTAPWNFDEPLHTQDFWALRRYGLAIHRARTALAAEQPSTQGGPVPRAQPQLDFRVDISRPQWQRDLFDGLVATEVVGHEFYRYRREIVDRQRRAPRTLYNYGTPSRAADGAHLLTAWCLLAWAEGADGVIPWQSLGEDHSWQKEDNLSLIYPARSDEVAPHPSLRLKALLRGQQDVEYLSLLEANGWPRWQLRLRVFQALDIDSSRPPFGRKELHEIVGHVTLEQLASLRAQLRHELDTLRPAPAERLVDFAVLIGNPPTIDVWNPGFDNGDAQND